MSCSFGFEPGENSLPGSWINIPPASLQLHVDTCYFPFRGFDLRGHRAYQEKAVRVELQMSEEG